MTYAEYCALEEGVRVRLLHTSKSKRNRGLEPGAVGTVAERDLWLEGGYKRSCTDGNGTVFVRFGTPAGTVHVGVQAVFLERLPPAPEGHAAALLAAFGGAHA